MEFQKVDLSGQKSMDRHIQVVIDHRQSDLIGDFTLDVVALLDPLSAIETERLKDDIRKARYAGQQLFSCPVCSSALHIKYSPARAKNGQGAFFSHLSGSDCPLADGNTISKQIISATKFNGKQEGERHHFIKHSLLNALQHDDRFRDAIWENRVVGKDGKYRRPDVTASFGDRKLAFDIQLATLDHDDIRGREEFYEANGWHFIWLLSPDDSEMSRVAFRNIYFNNDIQYFSFDHDAMTRSQESLRLHLSLHYAERCLNRSGLGYRWERKVLSLEEICWNSEGLRPRGDIAPFVERADSFGKELTGALRNQVVNAILKEYERTREGRPVLLQKWNDLAKLVQISPISDLNDTDISFRLIRKLVQIAGLSESETSKAKQITNAYLNCSEAGCWLHVFEQVVRAYGHEYLLVHDKTARKLAELRSKKEPDFSQVYGDALELLFPRIALDRLSPSEDF